MLFVDGLSARDESDEGGTDGEGEDRLAEPAPDEEEAEGEERLPEPEPDPEEEEPDEGDERLVLRPRRKDDDVLSELEGDLCRDSDADRECGDACD